MFSKKNDKYNKFQDTRQDTRQINRELFKIDNTLLNNEMVSIINTADISAILIFFQNKFNSSFVDNEDNSPLHLILLIDNTRMDQNQKKFLIKKLIVEPFNIYIDTPNKNQETPLHIAIKNQYEQIVKLLLEYGANANTVNAKYQNSLHLALLANIKPCETIISPGLIIPIDDTTNDNNTIYKEALDIFYKYRQDIQPIIEIIKNHATKIYDFYEHKHQTKCKLNKEKNKIYLEDTPIETSLKNIQNTFLTNILNPNSNTINIKKEINTSIIKSIKSISTEYENFIKLSLSEINIESNNLLDLKETDINIICRHILSSNNTNDDIEETLQKTKIEVLFKIYDNIDNLLHILNNNYNIKRRDVEILPKILLFWEFAVINTNDNKLNIYIDNNYNDINYQDNIINNIYIYINPNIYYIIQIDFNNYYETLFNNIYSNSLYILSVVQEDAIKSKLKEYNILYQDDFQRKEINIFIYLYHSNLYYDKDTEDINIKNKIIQYYNMLLDGSFKLMRIVDNFQINNNMLYNLNTLEDSNIVDNINNILNNHINTLNLWLALDNIHTVTNFNDDQKIYHIILKNKLNNFLLVENNDDVYYSAKTYNNHIITNQNGFNNYIPGDVHIEMNKVTISPVPVGYIYNDTELIKSEPIKLVPFYINFIDVIVIENIDYSLLEINFIPNSYSYYLGEYDYMNYLKKRFIIYLIKNSVNDSNDDNDKKYKDFFNKLYNDIKNLINNYFRSENLSDEDITMKTIFIIIKILDRLFINTVKSEIYLISIKKLKSVIITDNTKKFKKFKDDIIKFLDQILHNSNTSIKLNEDIKINVNIPTDLIDTDYITNLSKQTEQTEQTKPTEIIRKDIGNYIVYYPTDYISLETISIRYCMYNTTAIIETLFKYSNINYFTQDINKLSPIYYAIQSGNYLLIDTILKNIYDIDDKRLILCQLNGLNQSPLLYAYHCVIKAFIQPEYESLNVTYINRLLLSADISRNIPTNYYNMYKLIIKQLLNIVDYIELFNNVNDISSNLCIILDIIKLNEIIHKLDDISDIYNKSIEENFIKTYKTNIDKLNNLIIAEKPIELHNTNIDINIDKEINILKKIVIILEERHQSFILYNVDKSKKNSYNHILINLGIISIYDIVNNYYRNIIIKIILTLNIYNFDNKEHEILTTQISNIINEYIVANIFDLVRLYYNIKLTKSDNIKQDSTIIEDYLNKLLDELSKNGIIIPDSTIYENIKQHVNTHMIELIKETLKYNQIILDIYHRWTVNLYHSLKTFQVLINIFQ